MKFYDREKELGILENLKGNFRIAVVGRRRLGKTRLIEEFYKDRAITLFVSAEKAEKEIVAGWIKEYGRIYIPPVETFKDVMEYLFSKQEKIVFIDELQNSLKVNKSFVFDLQRLIDKHKPALVVSGSLISVMKKLVENYKNPLFGRFDAIIKLRELDFPTIAKICKDLGLDFETAFVLYSVFGGIPKYYELIEKMKRFERDKFIVDMFVYYPMPLYEEVRTSLKEEFGGEHKMYFSILSAISQGNNTLGEIAGFVGREQTKITKYINLLGRDFEVIVRKEPLIGSGKKGIYEINSNILEFWFSNVWKYQNLLERMEERQLADIVLKNREQYTGRMFEKIITGLITHGVIPLPFKYDRMGRQWGKFKGEKGKNTYEIDIITLNEQTKEILFAECKWQDKVDAKKVLVDLKEKAKFVQWNNDERKEYYAIFAKSFKERIKEPGLLLFDLRDFERTFSPHL